MERRNQHSNWLPFLSRRSVLASPMQQHRRFSLRLDGKPDSIDENTGRPYISNAVRTSRYTVWNFLPKQLFYQFSRLANFYFLIVAILQAIPGLSTTGKFTTLIPLLIFLSLTIAKEGVDDWKRYQLDRVENAQSVTVLREPSISTGKLQHDGSKSGGHALVAEAHLPGFPEGSGYQWTKTTWEDIKVGEVIALSRDENVPADIVLLHATEEAGVAYIETMDLDGETNLKTKSPPAGLGRCDTVESIAMICPADFTVEIPNPDLYRFDGSVVSHGITIPLTLNEIIYRGSVIRNTTTAIGIVINTGEDCKIRKNANRKVKPKRASIEHLVNRIIIILMLYVIFLAVACSVGYIFWQGDTESTSWYLENATVPFVQIFIGFVIMFNHVIPLSLYVGLEAIRIGQMSLITGDLGLYHEETDTPAKCHTTSNIDDLGQIKYVFTDKTGTLTENIMKLRRLSIAGISWSHLGNAKKRPSSNQHESSVQPEDSGPDHGTSGLTSTNLLEYIRRKPDTPLAAAAKRYILALALCHTCLPEAGDDGQIDFQASSPDELALVRGAQEMGFLVIQRSTSTITVQTSNSYGFPSSQEYRILDVIHFSSSRKRMSIIVQCPDAQLWLISKGADSIILPRLRIALDDRDQTHGVSASKYQYRTGFSDAQSSAIRETFEDETDDTWSHQERGPFEAYELQPVHYGASTSQSRDFQSDNSGTFENLATFEPVEVLTRCSAHIDDYATEGLRTMVYADRFLSEDDYREWKRLYHEAETSLVDRQERIEEVSDLIEHSLDLVGAAAIEDKLQKGVPETIQQLRRANIKIWMLTGDKRETAISIAHSTRICTSNSTIIVIDFRNGHLESQLLKTLEQVQPHGARTCTSYPEENRDIAVVIDGETLTEIEGSSDTSIPELFRRLMPLVDSVIFCRASPSQKALLVSIIRKGSNTRSGFSRLWKGPKKALTLAIGDGANDVAMITSANVGIGISGHEGQQAARSADFSISQFRFLSRLLLVHGRWNYYRTTRFVLSTFWTEVFFFIPAALYQRLDGASGTSLYDSTALVLVSLLTAAATVIIGTWDRDLQARTLLAVPELYVYGQNGDGLTFSTFLGWMGNAIFAGIAVFAGSWLGYVAPETIDDNGIYALGTLVFSIAIIWANCKILIFETHHKTIVALVACLGSIFALWVYNLIASVVGAASPSPYAIHNGFISRFGRDPAWWITLLVVLGILIIIEAGLKSFKQNHAVRAVMARCTSRREEKVIEGVRDGFRPWEPRLWQETEKDPAVINILESQSNLNY
ncbi:hypothetical protein F4810DRAFT_689816 [Camillea tinctor]|nr:hypothetical protein F4810DRAFT_689816 [Camillea tinctor]